MLDKQKLYDGLVDALTKGMETEDSGEGEKSAKHSDSDVAGFIADAIAAYASDAEIGPLAGIMIPAAPSPIPSSANGQMPKVQTADVGTAALKAAILAGFQLPTGDSPLAMMTTGLVAYAAASFVMFQAGPANCPGAAVMPPPPLAPVCFKIQENDGTLEDWADSVATAIHTSFKATIFTGACTASDGGLGPAIFPLQ